MSLMNPNNLVNEQRLSEFYQQIYPYLGGGSGKAQPKKTEIVKQSNVAIADGTAVTLNLTKKYVNPYVFATNTLPKTGWGGLVTVNEDYGVTYNSTNNTLSFKTYTNYAQNYDIYWMVIELNDAGGGSGGGSTIERLCYGEDRKEADTAEIRLLTLTEDTNFSEYLSYDTTTKLFTVEKAFSARLIVWIYNYAASSKVPQGKLVINDSSVALYSAFDNSLGSTGGIDYWTSLSVGDTIGIGPNVTNGYPQVRIKIYKLDGIFEQELFVKSYENSGQGYSV